MQKAVDNKNNLKKYLQKYQALFMLK